MPEKARSLVTDNFTIEKIKFGKKNIEQDKDTWLWTCVATVAWKLTDFQLKNFNSKNFEWCGRSSLWVS